MSGCRYILTRGKNKGKMHGAKLKKGCLDRCAAHFEVVERSQCLYIGPRSGKQCQKYSLENDKYCAPCKRKIINAQDKANDVYENKKSKQNLEDRRLHALALYKVYATKKLMEYSCVNAPDDTEYYSTEKYIRPDKTLKNGKVIKGRCMKIDPQVSKVNYYASDMGSGKTKQMVKFVNKNLNFPVLIISCKISLANDLKSNFSDFEMYNLETTDMKTSKHLIIQAESLHRLKLDYDIVIIDEAFSLRTQMFSMKTHKEHITVNQWTLLKQIRTCSKVILMDADVNIPTLEFYSELSNEKITLYRNCFNNPNKPQINIICGKFELFAEQMYNELEQGNRVVFCTNSKIKGAKIIDYLEKLHIDDGEILEKNVYYHSGNPFPSHVQNNGKDYTVRDDFIKYELVLYSPTISQGVDFNVEHFNVMYGYYTNGSNNCFQFKQQTGRIRNLKNNVINIFTSSIIKTEEYWDDVELEPLKEYKHIKSSYLKSFYKDRQDITEEYLKSELNDNDETKNNIKKGVDDFIQSTYNLDTDVFKKHFIKIKKENKLSSVGSEICLEKLFKSNGYKINNFFNALKIDPLESEKLITGLNNYSVLKQDKKIKKYCKSTPPINDETYREINALTGSGLLNLRLAQIYKTDDVEKQEYLMNKELYKKRRYQLEKINGYMKVDKLKNTIIYKIPNKWFVSIMSNEFLNFKYIKNCIFDKAITRMIKEFGLKTGDIYKSMIFNQINFKKHNPDEYLLCVMWQRQFCLIKLLNRFNLDIFKDGYNSLSITDKVMKSVFSVYNQFGKILNTPKIEEYTLKNFNLVIKKSITSWNGIRFKKIKQEKINDEYVNFYKNFIPFKGFDEYIENCNNEIIYNNLCQYYNDNKGQCIIPVGDEDVDLDFNMHGSCEESLKDLCSVY